MPKFARLLVGAASALLLSAGANAAPVTFTLDSLSVVGSQPVTTTLLNPPIAGTGDLTFDASQNLVSGSLALSNFSLIVDLTLIAGDDATITTENWTQTLVAAALTAGKITLAGGTAGGTTGCTVTGALGGLVCPSVSTTVTPFGAGGSATQTNTTTLVFTSFNSPTDFAGTITSVTLDTANGGSTTTLNYSFASVVPEPGTIVLLASGLLGLAVLGRRKEA